MVSVASAFLAGVARGAFEVRLLIVGAGVFHFIATYWTSGIRAVAKYPLLAAARANFHVTTRMMKAAGLHAAVAAIFLRWKGRISLAVNFKGKIRGTRPCREHFLFAPFADGHDSNPNLRRLPMFVVR
jgi:hypothetical protein